MRVFLQKRWFLLALGVLIPGGLLLGTSLSPTMLARGTEALGENGQRVLELLPRLTTALVLFLMSFSLDSRQLQAAMRSPGPVLWASVVNYGFIPLLAWPLMVLQSSPDFSIGLMIAASAPCTMAAASVWTRKAGGNDAVSLMVTLVTNGLCFLLTPLWMNLAVSAATEVRLDAELMMWRLVTAVLVPSLAGQLLRQIPGPAAFARKFKTPIGVVAQSCILLIVALAAFKAGRQLVGTHGSPGLPSIVIVWTCAVAIHLAAMAVAISGSRRFGFSLADTAATAFAGS
ncbi:MAG: bile acid:sodium symporter, partial [Planctomycetaceae bacterium]|nr:bile acid:sodium symporter [Planctomycetaceae bacterium]